MPLNPNLTRSRRRVLAVSLGAVVLLAACGSSASSKSGSGGSTTSVVDSGAPSTTGNTSDYQNPYGSATTAAPPTTAGGTATPVVSVTSTKLGLTLVDSAGKTLYEYKPDPAGSSTCSGACASLWPPLTTTATPVAVGKGLTASMFTVVTGSDGSKIVAISGHPLYRFSGDAKAGDTNGEGLAGVWHAAGPLGNTM